MLLVFLSLLGSNCLHEIESPLDIVDRTDLESNRKILFEAPGRVVEGASNLRVVCFLHF